MPQESDKISAPWTGFDVFLILALWVLTCFIADAVATVACDAPNAEAIHAKLEARKYKSHPIVQLVEGGKDKPMVLLVAFLAAVMVAPLLEEFLFRLLLQGWLETRLSRFGFHGASGIALVAVSLCFAAVHIDNHGSFLVPQVLVYKMTANVAASLLVFTIGIIYLVWMRNVKISHVLFGSDRFFRPGFFINAGYCLGALVLIYGLTAVLMMACPDTNISPIPLFFFSLLLGLLYSRTHNLLYCILLHAALNGTSLTIVYRACSI